MGQTGDNPSVGCVIVKDGVVIGEGATASGGRPHAEELALIGAGDNARDAVVYVTLEPCGERSSGAPSCARRLIEAGVEQVFIACADASPLASGRGAKALVDQGIAVQSGLLQGEASALYARYAHKSLERDD